MLSSTNLVPVWKVACYTAASPLTFSECESYVDTGVVCGSLCSMAFHKICQSRGRDNVHIGAVVSVGTGQFQEEVLGVADAHEYLTFGSHWVNPALGVERLSNLVSLYRSGSVSGCTYSHSMIPP